MNNEKVKDVWIVEKRKLWGWVGGGRAAMTNTDFLLKKESNRISILQFNVSTINHCCCYNAVESLINLVMTDNTKALDKSV